MDCGNWARLGLLADPDRRRVGHLLRAPRASNGTAARATSSSSCATTLASDLYFQTSDTTWQAYNTYGGNSLYRRRPARRIPRAHKVSYNRPFTTRGDRRAEDWIFNAEYPMVRWLERNGYDVSYVDRRRHRPPRRADQQPQGLHVHRP